MVDRSNISNVHWQKKLVPAKGDILASDIVTDYDDIEQEIRIIISTQIGSVPTNPLKGCNLMPLIDLPSEEATPLICQVVWDAITAWVTRVEVGSISAEALDVHHWQVIIPWRVKDDALAQFKQFDLNVKLAGGLAYAY